MKLVFSFSVPREEKVFLIDTVCYSTNLRLIGVTRLPGLLIHVCSPRFRSRMGRVLFDNSSRLYLQ